jgi:hypothetical protein
LVFITLRHGSKGLVYDNGRILYDLRHKVNREYRKKLVTLVKANYSVHRVKSLKPLIDLRRLHTLGFGYAMVLHKQGLDDLARMPQLQTLYLPDLRAFPELHDTVNKLSQSQTLKRIHYGVSWDDAVALGDLQSQVAGMQVKPSKFRPARHIILFFALLVVAIAAFPILQLAGQLSLASSYLAPHYRAPHFIVAGLLITPLIVVAIGWLIYVGVDLLTGSSLILFSSSLLFWSENQLPSKGDPSRGATTLKLLIAVAIGIAPFLVVVLRFFHPMLVEGYLMSGHVLTPIACFTTAAWLSWTACSNLQSQLRARLELGLPATLSFHDFQTQNAQWPESSYSSEPGSHQPPIGIKLPVVAKTALAVTLLSIPIRAIGYENLGRMALMTCLGAAFVCVFLTTVKWWQDMPYFAATTVRPPDRMGHVHRLMQGIRSDILSLLPLLLACVIAIGLVGPLQIEGMGIRLLHAFVAVTSVTLAVYAAILWVLTIRSVIGIAIVFLVCYVPCSMMIMEIVVLDQIASPLQSAITIILSGCALAAIAIIAIVLVKRYFARVEWARFR